MKRWPYRSSPSPDTSSSSNPAGADRLVQYQGLACDKSMEEAKELGCSCQCSALLCRQRTAPKSSPHLLLKSSSNSVSCASFSGSYTGRTLPDAVMTFL